MRQDDGPTPGDALAALRRQVEALRHPGAPGSPRVTDSRRWTGALGRGREATAAFPATGQRYRDPTREHP